ncbi:MAG TPA: hypothetical protein DEG42_06605 [Acholeplasmataceae bacterium]|nr:MAG: hypothetical protein A2Y43_00400 [Tenericutes bacterium GWA2_38_26]OHE30754.1 MAG: hypothetical protein A2084_04175 [Tenericutes bacterium GWC2_39_45]OHE31734.1 MAG: hypothetical protein A2009_01020 [Tenericutes bacterium GWD2_38_27]OHE40087.1 MAG: hypothetical protein A2013_03685 [Tenericutes bacterium GWE2_38_8]OHE40701.1 MAG: hypothetical protein A2102_04205 [Tenericutes bacterium GWF2_38_8]HBG33594.1 hypothetical protein [Acholeplasmataceae bacterium]
MKIHAMHVFEGLVSFNKFSDFLEIEKWRIEKQLLKERVEKYGNNESFFNLKKQFNEKKLSMWELKDEEVITWMDTSILIRRLLVELFKKGINAEQILIVMEYPLVFGNHMRSDYLIVYDRLIVVLEFGMFNQDEKRSEERYTKKLQESINYRQLIGNMVSKEIQVVNYVMIYLPEYDRHLKKELVENTKHNHEELMSLSRFLVSNIRLQDSLSAKSQMELLDSYK